MLVLWRLNVDRAGRPAKNMLPILKLIARIGSADAGKPLKKQFRYETNSGLFVFVDVDI